MRAHTCIHKHMIKHYYYDGTIVMINKALHCFYEDDVN